jgi:FecR-like protein
MFRSLRIASRSAALTLLAALLACVPISLMAATTASHGDIVVVTVRGTISATMAGMTVPLSAGAILQLPATVRTGADGAVELRQGPSTFAAAGNTELEIPQSAAEDGLIERIVQIRGNAFYSIGKRTGTRLRVEAPYLVAVIKGTQFNVAVQEDSTTIALFEGHLEVRASDDSDVVDLDAGEIAIRHRNDVTISVLRLNAARGDARRNSELARSDNTAARPPRLDTTTTPDSLAGNSVVTTREPERVLDAIADTSVSVDARTAIDLGGNDSKAVTASVDAGVSAAGGAVSIDMDVATTVDVGAGNAAAVADVGVAAGPVSADVGTSAAVDVPAGTINVAADASVAAVGLPIDAGAAVGVDAGTGNVGADVGVGNVNVGVDVGTSGIGLDVGTESGGGLLGGLGGLLGGGRKRN